MCSKVTSDSEVAPAIRTISCEVKIKNNIVLDAQNFKGADTKWRVFGKNEQTARFITHAQFNFRTQHSF